MKPVLIPPPGTANRTLRLCWQAAWLLLYRPSPVPMHGWRRLLLRCFGARIGAGAHPYPSARVWAPWNLTMGAGSCLGPFADAYNVADIHFGPGVIVSQKAYLCTASHDWTDPSFPLIGAPIHLGDGAWVAADAFIGPGVSVGNGAVIGARAVVMRDVDAQAVMAGNPAKIIKMGGTVR